MKSSKSFALGFALAAVLLTLLAFARNLTSTVAAANTEIYRHLNLFGEVFEQVRAEYVVKPDDLDLIRTAIDGMVNALDPHSDYLTPEEYQETRTEVRGEFGGLGIRFLMDSGTVRIITTLEGTPAEEVGLREEDRITHIDGDPVEGFDTDEVVERMRGPVGSPIELTVARDAEDGTEIFDVEIVRALIQDIPVRSEIRESKVGYIRIRQFNDKTMLGIERAFRDFKTYSDESGTTLVGYILDLRSNPGGLLSQAIEVSDAFMEHGEVLTTRGRRPETIERFTATGGDLADDKPLIVMINGASASASEIVAGALQDMQRATVIGTRSFGKGSVQSIIPLGDEGALRLTTARYYTPSGRSIQSHGIDPDIIVHQQLPEGSEAGDFQVGGEASLRGHLDGGQGREQRGASGAFIPQEAEDDFQLRFATALIVGEQKHEAFPPKRTDGVRQ